MVAQDYNIIIHKIIFIQMHQDEMSIPDADIELSVMKCAVCVRCFVRHLSTCVSGGGSGGPGGDAAGAAGL